MTPSLEERRGVLLALLEWNRPLDSVLAELGALDWDVDDEIVTLRPAHLVKVLGRLQTGECTPDQVERWANAIEGRDSIGLDEKSALMLREAIFELANPTLQGTTAHESATKWIERLGKQAH